MAGIAFVVDVCFVSAEGFLFLVAGICGFVAEENVNLLLVPPGVPSDPKIDRIESLLCFQ